MPLNNNARIEKISEIKRQSEENSASLRTEIPWKDKLEVMTVCQIPLDCLVYNNLNGRILSRTQSLETQNKKIDAEKDEDNRLIEDLLWNSAKQDNETTLLDIHKLSQQKIGIITRDGIVIDGNRRLMLLNELKTKRHTKQKELSNTYDYFKAVVLPVTKDEDLAEIEKLEITYQLGEDQKVDYKPINLYLKIQRQYKTLANKTYDPNKVDKKAIKTIYGWIGNYKTIAKQQDIEFFLSVMNTMDRYLDYFDYNGIYLALDNREEQFRGLTSWLNNFRGAESIKSFDGYKESDVDDLESLCFDLIRFGLQNMEFRKIGQGQRENHFFGNKEIWTQFSETHSEFIELVKDSETAIDYNSQDLESHIHGRDKVFGGAIKKDVEDNISVCYELLKNKENHDKPEKLTKKIISALNEINPKANSFANPDVQRQLKDIADRTSELLYSGDVLQILQQSLNWLIDAKKSIDDDDSDEHDEKLNLVKDINKLSHTIKKTLGG